jgi:hypothetical protein
MMETLAFGQVEIERASGVFEAGGGKYPAGSYIIRMAQPYSAFAKTLLEVQQYPGVSEYPGGPPQRPYDVTAHSLPLLMGVDVHEVADPFQARLTPATSYEFELRGLRPRQGVLPAADIDSWKEVNRVWSQGGTVWRDDSTGDFHLEAAAEGGQARPMERPRVGLYRSYVPVIDEGWTRWLLDQYGFEYQSLANPDIAGGRLNDRFDVILFPDQPASSISDGYAPGSMPVQYTGGLDDGAVAALNSFVAAGGTLIFLNRSAEFALARLKLPVINAVAGVPETDHYCPGSLLHVLVERHPLTYGLPDRLAVWNQESPAFEVPLTSSAVVAARYPGSDLLASGWLLGEDHLTGRAALVELSRGSGRIILFGLKPQYRAQSYQTFKMLFNAIVRR